MRRPRLTYANVMSTLAVFIALGGTSYAVARNSVGTPQLKRNAVTSEKIRNRTIKAADLARGVIPSVVAGPRGARGAEGPSGPTGPTGRTGPAGPAGAPGQPPAAIAFHAFSAVGRTVGSGRGRVTLEAESFDTANAYDAANSRFIAPRAGVYALSGRLNTYVPGSTGGGRLFAYAVVNESREVLRGDDDTNYAAFGSSTFSGVVRLDAGDRVSMGAYSDRVETVSEGQDIAYMTGFYVGPG